MTGPIAVTVAFRSAVEGAYLAAGHLRDQLPKEDLPAAEDMRAGFVRYPPDSRELQIWLAWRRLILLERAWVKLQVEHEAATKTAAPEALPADPQPEPAS